MKFLGRCLMVLAMMGGVPTLQAEPAKNAEELFEQYKNLEAAFDPGSADLYDDRAYIENTRINPDGSRKKLLISGPEYKKSMAQAMPFAKKHNDTYTYSDVTYKPEKNRVRIRATRYSNQRKYSSPISLLVGRDERGNWKIYEELSQTQL